MPGNRISSLEGGAAIDFGAAGVDRPPRVLIALDRTDLTAGSTVRVEVVAADDLGVAAVGLLVNGAVTPLNAEHQAHVTPANGGLLAMLPARHPQRVAAGDVSGDGTGAFTVDQVVHLHAPPNEILTGDFDGNTLIDILIAYSATSELQWFLNTGTEFAGRTPIKLADDWRAGNRVVGDFDGDGITDVATLAWKDQAVVKVLLAASDGVLTESQIITPLDNGHAPEKPFGASARGIS